MKDNLRIVGNTLEISNRIFWGSKSNNTNFFPMHWHDNLEFDYVDEGSIQANINGRSVNAGQGEFLFFNSGEIHELKTERNDHVCIETILISYDILKEYFPNIDNFYFELSGKDESREKIKALLIQCSDIYRDHDQFYELELSIRFRQICSILVNECIIPLNKVNTDSVNPKCISNIKKAIKYMEDNYMKTITLNDIAQLDGLAPTYFSRFFKNITGDTFYAYLRTIRLYYAYDQLLNTKDPISQIAKDNGFANVKAFIVAFSEEYGSTPAKYRKYYIK